MSYNNLVMPVELGTDTKGKFCRWGQQGKKYYYYIHEGNLIGSFNYAYEKALKQGRAIEWSKHQNDS